jgi:hypothetical protein
MCKLIFWLLFSFLLSEFKFQYITIKFVWIVTYLSVVLLDVDLGLLIGVLVSIIIVVIKDQFFQVKTISKYKNIYVDNNFVRIPNQCDDSDDIEVLSLLLLLLYF